MKLKCALSLAILIPFLAACGGGGGGGGSDNNPPDAGPVDTDGPDDTDTGDDTDGSDSDAGGDGDTMVGGDCCLQEDRTPPPPGSVLVSASAPIVPNLANVLEAGPQSIDISDNRSFPGLRFGDFLMLNNAFSAGNTSWTDWRQSIALNDGNPVTAEVDWDWGLESQKGAPFETLSFPELIYGTVSPFERSGDFQATGLPVEEANRPDITITYNYSRTAGTTEAPLGPDDTQADANDSEHNVIIESFWHESCDIIRNGGPNDNQVMEMLIWYYHGERLPSGPADFIETAMIDGFPFDVYRKASNFNFLAYVAQDVETAERMSGTIDYSAFIEHMLANDERYGVYEVLPTDCFANIILGPEVFQGAGTFTINNFEITRTY